ncbi:MAG: response regulator [Methanosarcinales archaeon]|nr:response regulator [Methanosarcinales archaeon]
MKILIAEDSKNDRMLLKKLLTSCNYEVIEASNGLEALESVNTSKPDMIISDIMMPKMDGFTLLRNIKKNKEIRDILFIFYTANYVSNKDKQLATKLGVSLFIVKPIEPKELLKKIEIVSKKYTSGQLKPTQPVIETEEEYLRQYSDRVFGKLEEKYNELMDTKKFLDAILEDMADGVIVTDTDMNMVYCNKRMHEIMQCDLPVGKNSPMGHHMPCIPDMRYARHELFETEIINKKDNMIHLECIISSAINEEGEMSKHIGVFRDVTERNRAREEIDKKNREITLLYDIDRLFSSFSGSDDLIECALDKVMDVLQIEGGCVYIVDEEHDMAVVKLCKGLPSKFIELIEKQPLDSPGVQAVLSSDRVVNLFVPSIRIPGITEADQGYGVEQIFTVQLRSKGKVIGFADLMVSPYMEIHEEDMNLVESIGNLCGFALENLLMHEMFEKLVVNK